MTVVIVGVKNVFLRAQRVTVGSRVYLGWTRVDEPIKKVLVRKLSFLWTMTGMVLCSVLLEGVGKSECMCLQLVTSPTRQELKRGGSLHGGGALPPASPLPAWQKS